MKNLIMLLIIVFNVTYTKASEKEIIAEVVFENSTGQTLNYGEFFVAETNEKIKIYDTKTFTIKLPSKGKYLFYFKSDEFTAYTYYPVRIKENKNKITIRLEKKKEFKDANKAIKFPFDLEKEKTFEQIEQQVLDGKLNFIIHGLDDEIPAEASVFKEKYGIGVTKENCVIDPISFMKTKKNNQLISDYLTKKYGSDWLNELSFKPFGMK